MSGNAPIHTYYILYKEREQLSGQPMLIDDVRKKDMSGFIFIDKS